MEAIPCRYRACGVVFLPRRKGQVYHHPACRRADCLNRKYIPRTDAEALAKAILAYDEQFAQPLYAGKGVGDYRERVAWIAIVELAKLVQP